MKSYRASSLYINYLKCVTEPTTSSARTPKLTAKVKAVVEIRLMYRKAKLLPFSIELIQYRAILMIEKAHINSARDSLTGSGESKLIPE